MTCLTNWSARAAGICSLVLVLLGGGALVGCGDETDPASEDPPRPNIVLIVADDLGYGDLGSYGQEQIQTPHLDRMAEEGLRFTQFYAGSTVCAPSRSVLMTGQHTGRTPIRGNREIQPIGQHPLPDSSLTVAEVLQEAGYRTGAFGKWGLGGPESEGHPLQQGFDEFYGYLGQRRAHFYYPEFLFHNHERVTLDGNAVGPDDFSGPGAGPPVERGTYSHDAIMEKALAFIDGSAEEQPFFAYLPVTIPHASVVAPEEAFGPYTDEDGNSIFEEEPHEGGHYTDQPIPKAAYAAMVSHLDQDVGRIVERLHELGMAENTLVLFTSDNGPHREGGYDPAYFNSNGPLRGMKGDLYEGGLRVPHLAWWPDRIEGGTTTDHVGYFADYVATFAELAGTEPPGAASASVSFAPTLLGRPEEQPTHEALYWEFYGGDPKQAVRVGRWKAVRHPMWTGSIQLYDLETDEGEARDVSGDHPEVVEEMNALMDEAHKPSPVWDAPARSSE